MNLKSLITGTFLLALSSTKAAAVRKTNRRTPHTSRVLRLTTLSPSVQSCQECKDGFRISTCIEVAYDSGGNATDQSVEQDMNITAAATCLLHVEGLDGESITSTCTCNARTNDSDIGFQQDPAQPSRFGLTAVLTVMFVYVACPVFMCAWFVSSCLRNRDEMSTGSTLRTQQEEPDSDDARKQRECVLAILFPSSVEKDECPSCTTMALESDDLEAQEDKSGELCDVPDVATTCSICLEDLGSKSSDKEDAVSGPCSHLYHRECIMSWLKEGGHDVCPYCRQPMWDLHAFEVAKASLANA